MLLMQNSARQLRLATVVGEAGLANIGRKTFYLRGFQNLRRRSLVSRGRQVQPTFIILRKKFPFTRSHCVM